MSTSNEDGRHEGKLSIDVMESILDSIPTTGLSVPNRMGMDAAIVRIDGEKIFCFSEVAFGLDEKDTAERIISEMEKRASEFGKIIVIDPVVLFPPESSVEQIKRIVSQVAEAIENHGITVGKGHTETTSKVRTTALIATVFGSVTSK